MSGITREVQYARLAEDWRHVNNLMWGIPSAAIAIISGVIVAAYQPDLIGFPRIITLGLGSIFLFALTVEIIKKRLLMNAISARLYLMEDTSELDPFPSGTEGLLEEVEKNIEKRNIEKNRRGQSGYTDWYTCHIRKGCQIQRSWITRGR